MKIRPTIPTEQLNGFLNLRRTSINYQARQIFDEFSRVEDLKTERKLGTIEAPVRFSISADGGLTTTEYITVELLIHRGYFVAHNSAATFSENGQRITEPLRDELYEMIVPATPKFQFASGDLKHKVIKAIVKAVEPIPEGRDEEIREIILPLLKYAGVNVIPSIEELPNCRLLSRHSVAAVAEACYREKYPKILESTLNKTPNFAVIGNHVISFFIQDSNAA